MNSEPSLVEQAIEILLASSHEYVIDEKVYRILQPDEPVQPGDEYLSRKGDWVLTTNYNLTPPQQCKGMKYRRPLHG
jgi:hypothetical protein